MLLKKSSENKLTVADTESGSITVQRIHSDALFLKPKERICSIGLTMIETKLYSKIKL